jgi:hypothetical protein
MRKGFLYRTMMAAFRFRRWTPLVKFGLFTLLVVFALVFALETLGLSIFWLNGGGF